eukprot:8231456-Ditylum_brightwellii.AAC.1
MSQRTLMRSFDTAHLEWCYISIPMPPSCLSPAHAVELVAITSAAMPQRIPPMQQRTRFPSTAQSTLSVKSSAMPWPPHQRQ